MANIEFRKPFQYTGDISFQYDLPISISLVTISATLRKPLVSIQLSRVHEVSIAVNIPKPLVSIQLSRVHAVTIEATLRKPLVTFYSIYDNNVWRGVQSILDSSFDETIPLQTQKIGSSWDTTTILDTKNSVQWKDSKPETATIGISLEQALDIDLLLQSTHNQSVPINNDVFSSFDVMLKCDENNKSKWNQGKINNNSVLSSTDQCIAVDTNYKQTWKDSKPINKYWDSSCDVSIPLNKDYSVPYDTAKRRPGAPWYRPIITPVEPPDIRTADIIFGDVLFEYTTQIIFGKKTILNKILSKRLYYMLHNFYLRRVADNAEIQISRIDATCSMSDYTWGFSFNVLGKDSYNKLIEYGPMELELQVNRLEMEVYSY